MRPPASIPALLVRQLRERPDGAAVQWRHGPDWRTWSWRELAGEVCRLASGLRSLGVKRGDRALLMMRNIKEFHVIDTALMLIGACPISIYPSTTLDQVRYFAANSEAVAIFAEDPDLSAAMTSVRGACASLAHIACVVGEPPPGSIGLASISSAGVAGFDIAAAARLLGADDLATVVYTSGTTGPPKGVMLDHRNVLFTTTKVAEGIGHELAGSRWINYLPMAHIANRIVGHYLHLYGGLTVYCCPVPSEIDSFLSLVRPNMLFGPPLIWERLKSAFMSAAVPELLSAIEVTSQAAAYEARDEPIPSEIAARRAEMPESRLADARRQLGLESCWWAVTGAAPMSVELLSFFRGLGIPLSENYGLSESTGVCTFDAVRYRLGRVGRALPGVELRVAPDGELSFRGANAFRGYLKDPDQTATVMDDEGWVRTGDIVDIDPDGYVAVIARKKDLIVTSGGVNVSPSAVEWRLKQQPLVDQVCVVEDGRRFISALIVLDVSEALTHIGTEGEAASLVALASDARILEAVGEQVERANSALGSAEKIRRFTVLPAQWLPGSDELTVTMKLRRRAIAEKYADSIEAMYRT
jgi:long-chain acyl-CoA synthetase